LRKKYVLDAGVLALYFAGSKKAKEYIDALYEERIKAFMCEVNVADFLYNYARVFGWEAALVKHSLLRNSPITIVGVDESLTVEAARLKLKYYKRLSLADCYLIALARQREAEIVTTDVDVKEVNEVPTVLLSV